MNFRRKNITRKLINFIFINDNVLRSFFLAESIYVYSIFTRISYTALNFPSYILIFSHKLFYRKILYYTNDAMASK